MRVLVLLQKAAGAGHGDGRGVGGEHGPGRERERLGERSTDTRHRGHTRRPRSYYCYPRRPPLRLTAGAIYPFLYTKYTPIFVKVTSPATTPPFFVLRHCAKFQFLFPLLTRAAMLVWMCMLPSPPPTTRSSGGARLFCRNLFSLFFSSLPLYLNSHDVLSGGPAGRSRCRSSVLVVVGSVGREGEVVARLDGEPPGFEVGQP